MEGLGTQLTDLHGYRISLSFPIDLDNGLGRSLNAVRIGHGMDVIGVDLLKLQYVRVLPQFLGEEPQTVIMGYGVNYNSVDN